MQNPKHTWYQHIWIGWPIALVFVGGAIGGACGGAAWALNKKVFQATSSPLLRYLWTGLISVAALFTYIIVAAFAVSFFHLTPPSRTRSSSATPVAPPPSGTTTSQRFGSVADAQREALRRYPQLGVAGSQFNNAFLARHKQYQQERPDYFRDPSWPVALAEDTAEALNLK